MIARWIRALRHQDEAGVVSAEYIAVTATAVVTVLTVAWLVLSEELSESAGIIATELLTWIGERFP